MRVLALMEARAVTGPAKNLMAFAAQAQSFSGPGVPRVQVSVATFERPSATSELFYAALRERDIPFHIIPEKHIGDFGVMFHLRRLVTFERPDIIQTHNAKSHFLTRLMGLKHKT